MLVYNVGATPCGCHFNDDFILDNDCVDGQKGMDDGHMYRKGTHKGYPYGGHHV